MRCEVMCEDGFTLLTLEHEGVELLHICAEGNRVLDIVPLDDRAEPLVDVLRGLLRRVGAEAASKPL